MEHVIRSVNIQQYSGILMMSNRTMGVETSFCLELYDDFEFFGFGVQLKNKKCAPKKPHKIRANKENTIVIRT